MPSKFVIKTYIAGGIYHLFNRGVDQRDIFTDSQDYTVFLQIIKNLLAKPPEVIPPGYKQVRPVRLSDVYADIDLIAFCLMPNHFHLLVQQHTVDGSTRFTRRLGNAYVKYFNESHRRRGSLFEGKLRSSMVDTDEYLTHVTRYIHRNPLVLWKKDLASYPYSSYRYYFQRLSTSWLKPTKVLDYFPNITGKNPYVEFVEFDNDKTDSIIVDITA